MPAPASPVPQQVAVIGAGLAGLACAHALTDAGWQVTVFDKGRGPGGRMSTRRSDHGAFDHGAQYFTARDERFVREVRRWEQGGHVAPWQPRLVTLGPARAASGEASATRWVGTPSMSAVVAQLTRGLDVRFGTEITGVARGPGGWEPVTSAGTAGTFTHLAVAVPAPQVAKLLSAAAPALALEAAKLSFAPCHAVMVTFPSVLELPFDAAFVNEGPLSWVARDSSKPGRGPGERWVLHSAPQWSQDRIDAAPDAAAEPLLEAFWSASGAPRIAPSAVTVHRWRYARVVTPLPEACVFDASLAAGLCGDGHGGARIEAAFLSGQALAARLQTL